PSGRVCPVCGERRAVLKPLRLPGLARLELERSAHLLGEPPPEVEPETGAGLLEDTPVCAAGKPAEDAALILRRDADPVIDDSDRDLVAVATPRYSNHRRMVAVDQRVVDQVVQNLAEQRPVGVHLDVISD